MEKSSHFQQAYSLLNLHLIHATDIEAAAIEKEQDEGTPDHAARGFKIYTPLSAETMVAASGSKGANSGEYSSDSQPSFTALQLLNVMYRLTQEKTHAVSYFSLCRTLGMRAVDDMVRGRLLELRWSEPVTPEGGARASSIVSVDDAGNEDLGPMLMPTTPIVAYAMRRVLHEYEYAPDQDEVVDEQAEHRRSRRESFRRRRKSSGLHSDDKSDYLSLSEVSEY